VQPAYTAAVHNGAAINVCRDTDAISLAIDSYADLNAAIPLSGQLSGTPSCHAVEPLTANCIRLWAVGGLRATYELGRQVLVR